MKFLHIVVIVSASITTVILQDPPPVFDLPPPTPFETPATEEKVDQTGSSPGEALVVSVTEVVNETVNLETNETTLISETSATVNDSASNVTDLTAASDAVNADGTNITADFATGIDVLESSSNVTVVDKVDNSTDVSNLTVTFTDDVLTDIIAAAVNESVTNNINASLEINIDEIIPKETANGTAVEAISLIDTNITSASENISSVLEMNATDSLIQTDLVDLPPVPISFDVGLKNESVYSESEANISDTQAHLDMNISSVVDTNETVPDNQTYIDEVNIYINDTGISIEHTPVIHTGPGSVPKSDPPPVPVDVPAFPPEKPSVDFIESSDSTTIEIADIFGALAGLDMTGKVSTPMGGSPPDTTTQEMPTVSDPGTIVPEFQTTTPSQPEIFTTQPSFTEFATSAATSHTMDPSYVYLPKEEIAPPPDHPPPIFSGGSRPTVYTDPYGPHEGYFPIAEQETTAKPVVTRQEAPPPIIVPTRSDSRFGWSGHRLEKTTASPYPKWPVETPQKQTMSGLNPRHMNVAELAAYALQMTSKKAQSNQNAQGIQVFFPTEPQTTTTRTMIQSSDTTLAPVREQQATDYQQSGLPNAFVEYLRKKYGVSNVAPTPPQYTTTARPRRKFYDAEYLLSHLPEITTQRPTLKKFFDSSYLLSHLDMTNSKPIVPTVYTTTQKPTTRKHFFDEKYLLSHLHELQGSSGGVGVKSKLPLASSVQEPSKRLPQQTRHNNVHNTQPTLSDNINIKPQAAKKISTEQIQGQSILKEQRQGQVDTRAINLKPNINPQSIINYNVNPERNVRMNINLKPNINQWQQQPKTFTQQPAQFINPLSHATRTTSSFKPVVYGTKPFNTARQSEGLSLRQRFNKKWYHPENKLPVKGTIKPNTAVKNINIHIENPSANVNQNPVLPGRNTEIQNNAMQEFALQHTNIEVQKQILKQQEKKLRQQQQQLQEQEAILLRQQQERQQRQQNQQQILMQQQERDRRIQLKFQQERLRQQEQDRLLQEQQLQQNLQQELQRQQQLLKVQETSVQQRDHERLLQLQLQRQLQLQKQSQVGQQSNTQNNQFPLASRTGRSEILQNRQFNTQQRHHSYQPNVQLSSIQIFRAPAMLKKQRATERQRSEQSSPQTHWRAPSNLQNIHGHLSVPYNLDPIIVPETTTVLPTTTTPTPNLYIATLPTVPVRQTTQSPTPTEPATADPNPPPIFDTKVQHTFMPMPKIVPTTKAPGPDANPAGGWDGTQAVNPQIDERCRGCVFVNDRCLLPDPVHCNFFIECVRQGSLVRAFSRECALGSFFDRKSFLCVDPKNADCPTDRCRIPGTKWYAIHGHCKHYWSCGAREGGGVFAQSECCPDMGGFVEPDGCVENPNCTDTCSSPVVMEGPTATSCIPMLSLPFDGGRLEDASNTKQHVGVEGISATMEGEAIYNGGGRLVLWRYANLMFPVVFAIKFRFFSTTPSPRQQIIFSNCDTKGGQEPSVEISLDTLYHEVVFKIDTYTGPPKRFTITYQQNKWTTVHFIYDGERIVGSVNGRARNMFAEGGIETRPNPLGVGSCKGKDGFKGLLDDIFVYEECIPDDMYGVFMSVLE